MNFYMNWLIENWYILAIILSFYWGIRGAVMNFYERQLYFKENWSTKKEPQAQILMSKTYIILIWSTYSFIFNFVGSLFGWFSLYLLICKINNDIYRSFGTGDLFLFFFALLGLTGHLPQALYGIVESLSKLAEIVITKLGGGKGDK